MKRGEVGKLYPEVAVDDVHIDAMAAHLVRQAHVFDVIVTENMFGDILSDLAGELVGSLGLAPSINTNDEIAMAQAAHGSAPDIAGKNIANPVGLMLSTVMLLHWLGTRHQDQQLANIANSLEAGISNVLKTGMKTRDLGGTASTMEFTKSIVDMLHKA